MPTYPLDYAAAPIQLHSGVHPGALSLVDDDEPVDSELFLINYDEVDNGLISLETLKKSTAGDVQLQKVIFHIVCGLAECEENGGYSRSRFLGDEK